MSEPTTARQFWVQAPGRGEIRSVELPPPRPDDALVRTRYSGISRGTESLVFRGEVPESQYQAMRAPFQEGDFPGPVKYGYASVGEVLEIEAGPHVESSAVSTDALLGRTVFCLHPHQDVYRVPAGALTVVPNDVPAERAVLAANMETAVNAVWDALPTAGDRVIVIGAGVVGLLIAWLCRQVPGTAVTLVDVDPAKRPVAEQLAVPFRTEPPPERDADLVIHASGDPEGLRSALRIAGIEATVVEVSWYGNRSVSLPLGEDFHAGRLTLRSSQVGRLAAHRTPRWDTSRRMRLALELLREPSLDALITGESAFDDLPSVLARLSHTAGPLCHRIRYA